MSRAFRQTLERIALLVVGLILGCWLLGDSGQALRDDEREASWLDGYRRAESDYLRALRKVETRQTGPLATAAGEPGAQ